MEMHYFPQAALFDLIAAQGCRVLEMREDDAIGLSVIAVSNTVLLQKSGLGGARVGGSHRSIALSLLDTG